MFNVDTLKCPLSSTFSISADGGVGEHAFTSHFLGSLRSSYLPITKNT